MNNNPYGLPKPTEKELAGNLEKVMGPEKAAAILREARAFCGSPHPGDPLLGLTKITVWLSDQKGFVSIVGRSMTVRINYYKSIHTFNHAYEQR